MLKINKFISLICISLFLVIICLGSCQQRPLCRELRFMLGTTVEVISSDKRALDLAFNEIKRIEELLSKFIPDSEISKLNKTGYVKVSQETLYVITKAKEFYVSSDGAFDITVGPLVELWKDAIKKKALPDDSDIKEALNLVGSDKVIIDDRLSIIKLGKKGMILDLGAIAKGFAVDCAIKKLKEKEIKSCLINAGGDIYCLGKKQGKPWRIGIRNPRKTGGIIDYLELSDKAVATSGDYEQFFILENKRFSHIINPHIGYPAQTGVISVTVVAPDCLTADALATSIFVLGKEKGLRLTQKLKDIKTKIIEE